MESWGVLLFVLDFLPMHMASVGAKGMKILEAGQHLVNFRRLLKTFGANLKVAEVQQLLDSWKMFMAASEGLDLWQPKTHLMYHLIMRSLHMGNPTSYQVFIDESLSRELKLCLRLCHQATFEQLGLLKMTEKLCRPHLRRRLEPVLS